MRLVDADEIRKKAVPHTRGDFGRYNSDIRKWAVLVGDIDDAPTVDAVEVVHGRWVEVDDGVLIGQGKHFECSECKLWAMPWRLSNYCPNCGAKMDGGDEDG